MEEEDLELSDLYNLQQELATLRAALGDACFNEVDDEAEPALFPAGGDDEASRSLAEEPGAQAERVDPRPVPKRPRRSSRRAAPGPAFEEEASAQAAEELEWGSTPSPAPIPSPSPAAPVPTSRRRAAEALAANLALQRRLRLVLASAARALESNEALAARMEALQSRRRQAQRQALVDLSAEEGVGFPGGPAWAVPGNQRRGAPGSWYWDEALAWASSGRQTRVSNPDAVEAAALSELLPLSFQTPVWTPELCAALERAVARRAQERATRALCADIERALGPGTGLGGKDEDAVSATRQGEAEQLAASSKDPSPAASAASLNASLDTSTSASLAPSALLDVQQRRAQVAALAEDPAQVEIEVRAFEPADWEAVARGVPSRVRLSAWQCRLRWQNAQRPGVKGLPPPTPADDSRLLAAAQLHSFRAWPRVAQLLGGARPALDCQRRCLALQGALPGVEEGRFEGTREASPDSLSKSPLDEVAASERTQPALEPALWRERLSAEQVARLDALVERHGRRWKVVAEAWGGGLSATQLMHLWRRQAQRRMKPLPDALAVVGAGGAGAELGASGGGEPEAGAVTSPGAVQEPAVDPSCDARSRPCTRSRGTAAPPASALQNETQSQTSENAPQTVLEAVDRPRPQRASRRLLERGGTGGICATARAVEPDPPEPAAAGAEPLLASAVQPRRGRWMVEEDAALRRAVLVLGPKWALVARRVPGRSDVQCRERWVNVLDPSVKSQRAWTKQEDAVLTQQVRTHLEVGTQIRWARIRQLLPGRTDKGIVLRWKQLAKYETCFRARQGARVDIGHGG